MYILKVPSTFDF